MTQAIATGIIRGSLESQRHVLDFIGKAVEPSLNQVQSSILMNELRRIDENHPFKEDAYLLAALVNEFEAVPEKYLGIVFCEVTGHRERRTRRWQNYD